MDNKTEKQNWDWNISTTAGWSTMKVCTDIDGPRGWTLQTLAILSFSPHFHLLKYWILKNAVYNLLFCLSSCVTKKMIKFSHSRSWNQLFCCYKINVKKTITNNYQKSFLINSIESSTNCCSSTANAHFQYHFNTIINTKTQPPQILNKQDKNAHTADLVYACINVYREIIIWR